MIAHQRGSACSCCSPLTPQVSKHATYERLYVLCARAIHASLVEEQVKAATLADVQQHMKQVLTR